MLDTPPCKDATLQSIIFSLGIINLLSTISSFIFCKYETTDMLDGFLGPFLRTRWVLIYVCLTLWLFSLLQRHRVQRRIRAIGGKSAPKIATFLPFGTT